MKCCHRIMKLYLYLYLCHAFAISVTNLQTPSCNKTSVVSSDFNLWDQLPKEWCEICAVDYDVDHNVNATVICHVTPRDQAQWRLVDLRTALTAAVVDSMHLELGVDVRCDPGTNISLPFPMRSPGLVKLKVSNCCLLDKYADSKHSLTATQQPDQRDWMRVMVIDSCTWINQPEDLDFVWENMDNLTDDLECGQDSTMVTYVYRNTSEETLSEDLLRDEFWEILQAENFTTESLLYGDGFGDESFGRGDNDHDGDGDAFGDQSFGKGEGDHDDGDSFGDTNFGPGESGHDVNNFGYQSFGHGDNGHDDVDGLGYKNLGREGERGGHRGGGNGDGSVGDVGPDSPGTVSGAASQLSDSGVVVSDEYLQGHIQLADLEFRCRFVNLETLDESFNVLTSTFHFNLLAQNSRYPKLTLLNYTSTGLTHVPQELREFRRVYPRSKLGIIDLSHNWIQTVGPIPAYPSRGVPTTLILQFNNITKVSFSMFKEWATVPDFYVDVRYNPITCDCALKDLITRLQNDSQWEEPTMAYYKGQVSNMTCATPPELLGKMIGSLGVEDLPCSREKASAGLRAALVALLVMTALLVVLVVLMVLMVRYRREVRILVYTRLHIHLQCRGCCLPSFCSNPSRPRSKTPGGTEEDSLKLYDAFVAYAHQDTSWVLESLVPHLEDSSSSSPSGTLWGWGRRPPPSARLCLHQRDFVVGKPIIDNIVDSIAASRHTVVVLSRSFVRSGWAMEELYQAYQQSLAERRRHLVLVMLEDVPVSQMAPVLRRCCQTFTYLRVSDSLFWDRLLYSIHTNDERIKPSSIPSALDTTPINTEDNNPTKENDGIRTKNNQPENVSNTTIRHTCDDQDGNSKEKNRSSKNGGENKGDDSFQQGGSEGEKNYFKNGGNKGGDSFQHSGGSSKGNNLFKHDDTFQDGGRIGQDFLCAEADEMQESCVGEEEEEEEEEKRAIFSEAMRSMSMESTRTSSTSESSASVPLTPSQLAWERPLIFEDV